MLPDYKQAYKVLRTIDDLSDSELKQVWWAAFDRDECDTIKCNAKILRQTLRKLLNQ